VPTVIIVDASVLVVALVDDGSEGDLVRRRLHGEQLAAPELIDLEVLSALRGLQRSGQVDDHRASLALADLLRLPMLRAPHRSLLNRCWELRHTMTAYDAAYVALAEALQCSLLTADLPLSRAGGLRCEIELLSTR
jgi:predicted nucleic acid-binding protein